MFFVDQVGVKAPGSPRRMTRRPLQRCAKFTALREKKTTRAPSSEERAVDAVDAKHNSKEPHQTLRLHFGPGKLTSRSTAGA